MGWGLLLFGPGCISKTFPPCQLVLPLQRQFTVPLTMVSFVWSKIGFDAGETPEHIVVRKEAERLAGSGEFWWGLDAPLGITVEVHAEQNGGSLPALFSKSRSSEMGRRKQVRIWDTWRSLFHPQQYGRIPDHVVVTSGHDPGRRQTRYALTCQSDDNLTLGAIGFCNLAECYSLKTALRGNDLRGAQVLRKDEPLISRYGPASKSVYSIAFKATVVGHSFVLLENFRVLTEAKLHSLLQFKAGDDWLSLAKMLRRRV
jgi:hypothetical protein